LAIVCRGHRDKRTIARDELAMTGKIIILNGTSSSGKTSILKALQHQFDEPFLNAGMDRFISMLPGRYLKQPLWNGELGLVVADGSVGHRLITGMHSAIAALAESGANVIADHVLVQPSFVQDLAFKLAGQPAWLIGVRCDLDVLKARETQRQNRTLGQAEEQFPHVHAHGVYDLEVDTTDATAAELAALICAHIDKNPPTALSRLAR
jgi:chloramphenicol 3-O phosphotransferase